MKSEIWEGKNITLKFGEWRILISETDPMLSSPGASGWGIG